MPEVTVLYFAALKDLVGLEREILELPAAEVTVSAFVAQLERHRSVLAGRLASVRVAVNEAFADAGEPIRPGDVVALIPPVSGG